MNKEPETYEELIRKKRCIDLVKYYELSEEDLDEIYNFLETYPDGSVNCGEKISLLKKGETTPFKIVDTKKTAPYIDGILMGNTYFNIINHYEPSSYSGYSGGSSSNNNNNNNNNNR